MGHRADVGILIYCPRSGSTKLAHELGARGVCVIPEFRGFEWLLGRSGEIIDREQLHRVWDIDPQTPNLGLDISALDLPNGATGADVLRAVATSFAARFDAQTALFKFGWGVAYRPQLLAAFGAELPVVALLRDGRAVVNSMLKSERPYPPHTTMARDDVWFAAEQWTRHLHELETTWLGEHERLALVRFEELVDDPDEVLNALVPFLSGSPSADGSSRFAVADDEDGIHHLVSAPLDPSRAAGWRTELDADSISLVEHLIGEDLDRLGYSTSTTAPTTPELLAHRLRHFERQLRFAALSLIVVFRGDATAPLSARLRTRAARLRGLGGRP